MIEHYLLSALRNLWHNRLSTAITLLSLCVGLTVANFAFLYAKRELSYDRGWPDADRIHRVVIEQRGIPGRPDGDYINSLARNYPNLLAYFPDEIEAATRVSTLGARPVDGEREVYFGIQAVDPAFAEIFQPDIVAGSLERALSAPGLLAIEERQASTMFEGDPLGQIIELVGSADGSTSIRFEVAAVFRLPEPGSPFVQFRILTRIDDALRPILFRGTPPWEDSHRIWIKLAPGLSTADFNARQADFIDSTVTAYNTMLQPGERISEHLRWRFQPVPDIYLNPLANEATAGGNAARVMTFSIIGVLVLLAGCSNAVSLGLTRAMDRQREIGIRKAVGALPQDIFRQHLLESVILAALAFLPSLLLLNALEPAVSARLSIRPALDAGPGDMAMLGIFAMAAGLAIGAWPALFLSRVRAQVALRGSSTAGQQGMLLRSLLVGGQFCVAQALLIITVVVSMQFEHLRHVPLGFDAENLVFLAATSDQERAAATALLNTLEQLPSVQVVRTANVYPPQISQTISLNNVGVINPKADSTEVKHTYQYVFPGHFSLMGIPLIAGRGFDPERDGYDTSAGTGQETRILMNRASVRALGFDSPDDAIDQLIYRHVASGDGEEQNLPSRIIGVVENARVSSPRNPPGPELYLYSPQIVSGTFLLRYAGNAGQTMTDTIRDAWKEVSGTDIRMLEPFDAAIEVIFRQEMNDSRLMQVCALLTLVLSCTGLYGLAGSILQKNIKEVGIRKALGASTAGITGLFLWRFCRPALLANLVAWPAALYFVLDWLAQFPDQLGKVWLLPLCLLASLIALLIAITTVTGVTTRAARTRPVESLRYE